jgi:hypothetical protein
MKINNVHFETIASCGDFYKWIEQNEQEFDFTRDEFHKGMVEYLFDEGILSSRFSQDWCHDVINKTNGAENIYWDNRRIYYQAILLFMQDYDLKTIRFEADW